MCIRDRLQTERDQKEGRDIYEITFQTEEREYEYDICTQDGVISKMQFEVKEGQNSQDKNAAKLTEEEAKKIALKMVEGAEEEDLSLIHIYRFYRQKKYQPCCRMK